MSEGEAKVRELADRYWEELLEIEPLLGTEVGDERFDDRLGDPSEAGLERSRHLQQRTLDALGQVDRAGLDEAWRGVADVLEGIANRALDEIRLRTDLLGNVGHLWGPAQLLVVIATLQRADTPERLDRYVARLRAFPRYFEEIAETAADGVERGITQPALVVDRTIAQVERLVAIPPEQSPGMKPVEGSSPTTLLMVAEAIRDHVLPAYQTYLEALRAYRPHAREDSIGLSALPDGEARYASAIKAWTTLPLTAEQVHNIGLEDLADIQDERRRIAESLGHPDGASAIAAYTETGANTAKTREEMVQHAEDMVQRGWDAASGWFGRLPKDNCRVQAVEEFREKDSPTAFYYPASADGSRQGIYYINTSDLDQRTLHQIASVTYHEANPGHHFQISIEQEFDDRPAIRRFGGNLGGSAFIEGWALYCERLADEMGLYLNEHERLGMLESQGWRACRLIVDTGMHALGWARDQAIDQMVEAGVSPLEAEIETDRYISMPGQALAYKIGQHEIEKWRSAAEKRAGADFSIKGFHDRLLQLGALPLAALERELGSA